VQTRTLKRKEEKERMGKKKKKRCGGGGGGIADTEGKEKGITGERGKE
jgi:hypothetical protein